MPQHRSLLLLVAALLVSGRACLCKGEVSINGVPVPIPNPATLPGFAPPPGAPVTDTTPLVPGQPVMIRWGNSYRAGRVVSLDPTGMVRVHYVDWSDFFDETLPRDRLRLPTS